MLSSIPDRQPSVPWASTVTALLIAAAGVLPPAAAAAAPAGPCRSQPASATAIAQAPWPQLRYDYQAIGQISDGTGVTVAVIDSGVDDTHPQLTGRVIGGADLLAPGGSGRVDCVGHGTAVASLIAARTRAGSGLRGLAPGARILPLRVTERVEVNGVVSGEGVTPEQLADAIRTAVERGATVVNLSLSVGRDSPALERAVEEALAAGVVIVAAAGNGHDRGDPTPYPAGYPGVIGVGAVGEDGVRVPSSQVGSYVDLVAPGADVTAAVPGRGHTVVQGTSFAVPFVAATAALLRAYRPQLSGADVARRLLDTADPSPLGGYSPEYGAGILNPLRALTDLVPAAAPAQRTVPSAAAAPPASLPRSGPSGPVVLATALALVLAALAVACVAAASSLGRRRRWRPGRVAPPRGR